MPATFNFYLRKDRPNKKGLCPIYLRITHNRKLTYLNTGIRILPSDWNEDNERVRRSHRTYTKINDDLDRLLENAQSTRRRLARENSENGDSIKRALESSSKDNFFELSEDYLDEIKEQSYYSWKQSRVAYEKLKEFNKSDQLPLSSIDVDFLDRFQTFLKVKRKNKASTIHKNLANISSVLDKAVYRKLIAFNPLKSTDFKIVKKNKPEQKTKLSLEQIQAIEDLQLEKGTNIFDARNAFILAFYFCGMRFGDLATLTWDNVRDDRLRYTMSKTGNNIDVKIPEKAIQYLDHYRNEGDYIFPFLNGLTDKQRESPEIVRRRTQSANAIVNDRLNAIAKLAEINESISMHVARHSFAQYGIMKGISVYKMMMLLGHQNIKTTQQYLKTIDVQAVDETMDEIF